MLFYEQLAALRRAKGISQETLAEQLGVSRQAVSKWERDLSCPDINSLPNLAEILRVSVEELMQVREAKCDKRGGFRDKIYWVGNEE